jgi:hypothetical protein
VSTAMGSTRQQYGCSSRHGLFTALGGSGVGVTTAYSKKGGRYANTSRVCLGGLPVFCAEWECASSAVKPPKVYSCMDRTSLQESDVANHVCFLLSRCNNVLYMRGAPEEDEMS